MFHFKEESGMGLCSRELMEEIRLFGVRQQKAFYVRVRTLENLGKLSIWETGMIASMPSKDQPGDHEKTGERLEVRWPDGRLLR